MNAWLWVSLIAAFSSLGVSRDWFIQLSELGLMIASPARCKSEVA
jgi:hypothetical protein